MPEETAKTALSTETGKHINWDSELEKAMKRVEDVIALDNESVYASILEKALTAIKCITREKIKAFVDAIPFPDFIRSFV